MDQSALLFAIQNQDGKIIIQNSSIIDTMSKSSLISLTFAQVELRGTRFLGNYAELSSNGISMIYSKGIISDCVIDNGRNNLNITKSIMTNVEAGFINMNYQSEVRVSNSTIKGFVA